MQAPQRETDYHQTVNLIISTMLVGTATFLFNINNQMIILTEKTSVMAKSIEQNTIIVERLGERQRLLELHKANKQ